VTTRSTYRKSERRWRAPQAKATSRTRRHISRAPAFSQRVSSTGPRSGCSAASPLTHQYTEERPQALILYLQAPVFCTWPWCMSWTIMMVAARDRFAISVERCSRLVLSICWALQFGQSSRHGGWETDTGRPSGGATIGARVACRGCCAGNR